MDTRVHDELPRVAPRVFFSSRRGVAVAQFRIVFGSGSRDRYVSSNSSPSPISARSTWSSWSSTLASASACFVPDGPSAAARLRALESRAVARAPSVPAEALSPVSNLRIACCAFAPPPGACAPARAPRARRDADARAHARRPARHSGQLPRRPRGRHRRVGVRDKPRNVKTIFVFFVRGLTDRFAKIFTFDTFALHCA